MAVSAYAERYRSWRWQAFRWRHELSTVQKIGLALGMAGITGLFAQIRIPLWFTDVPITGQVLPVLASGVLLGAAYGALGQALYLVLGACGVPWFQGWHSGVAYLTSPAFPTMGYLAGFILAAFLSGKLTEKYIAARRFYAQLGLMLVGVAIIYVCGATYYAAVRHTGFGETMVRAVLPFIPLDIAKAAAVAGISTALLPKTSYSDEVDRAEHLDGR